MAPPITSVIKIKKKQTSALSRPLATRAARVQNQTKQVVKSVGPTIYYFKLYSKSFYSFWAVLSYSWDVTLWGPLGTLLILGKQGMERSK